MRISDWSSDVCSSDLCVLETVVNSNSDTERVEWARGRYTGMEVVTVLARSGSKWDFPCRDFSSCVCQFNERLDARVDFHPTIHSNAVVLFGRSEEIGRAHV